MVPARKGLFQEMASDPVLPKPSDIASFRLSTSDKYVPKVFEKPSKVKFHNIYCELESYRRRELNPRKASLLRIINDADQLERGGRTEWKHQRMDITHFTVVENYNLTPYNIVLADSKRPSVKIDLLPTDLYSLLYSLSFVFARNKNNKYIPHVDVSVWGGRDVLRLQRVLPKEPESPSDYLGVYITVLSSTSVKKHLKLSGIGKILGHKLPRIVTEDQGIFISQHIVPRFALLIVTTYDSIYLNAEINSQYHATLQVVARKIKEMPNFTREDYYWAVLDSFYGLDVPPTCKLPSFYVLRLFHKEYLCEPYSLYYSDRCTCVECGKAGQTQVQEEIVEEEEELVEDDTDSEIDTLEYGSDIDL